jgi:hypothetical protein
LHVHRQVYWPIATREMIICASSLLLKEKKGAMIILRSINQERSEDWETPIPENVDPYNIVRAEMIKGFWFIEAIDKDNCWFSGLMNVNPNL